MTALADRVEGIVHEPTQVHDDRVDLTLAAAHVVAEAGRIDFGGGELTDADLQEVETSLRNPDDDYEWYDLEPGTYVVTFNESLTGEEPVPLRPPRELLARGGTIPSVRTATLGPVPLTVPEADDVGLRLKENARIGTLLDH